MVPYITLICIISIVFGVLALTVSSSRSQKLIDKRLLRIRATNSDINSSKLQSVRLLKVDPTTKLGWIEGILNEYKITHVLEKKILQADCKISVVTLYLCSIGLAIIGFAVTFLYLHNIVFQVAVACSLSIVPYGIVSFMRTRRITAFENGLSDAIDMMGRSLRAGHSIVASINIVAEQSVAPVSTEFGEVFKQQNFGLPLRDALLQMTDRVPSQDLRVLVTGILVQKDTGGNLTEILERISSVIRERIRIKGEIRTYTAQGRFTGYILCSLPFVMLVLINIANPGYSAVLFNTPTGNQLLYVGIGLLVVGALAIRQIILGIEV
jgi:tight adherence protein B